MGLVDDIFFFFMWEFFFYLLDVVQWFVLVLQYDVVEFWVFEFWNRFDWEDIVYFC